MKTKVCLLLLYVSKMLNDLSACLLFFLQLFFNCSLFVVKLNIRSRFVWIDTLFESLFSKSQKKNQQDRTPKQRVRYKTIYRIKTLIFKYYGWLSYPQTIFLNSNQFFFSTKQYTIFFLISFTSLISSAISAPLSVFISEI